MSNSIDSFLELNKSTQVNIFAKLPFKDITITSYVCKYFYSLYQESHSEAILNYSKNFKKFPYLSDKILTTLLKLSKHLDDNNRINIINNITNPSSRFNESLPLAPNAEAIELAEKAIETIQTSDKAALYLKLYKKTYLDKHIKLVMQQHFLEAQNLNLGKQHDYLFYTFFQLKALTALHNVFKGHAQVIEPISRKSIEMDIKVLTMKGMSEIKIDYLLKRSCISTYPAVDVNLAGKIFDQTTASSKEKAFYTLLKIMLAQQKISPTINFSDLHKLDKLRTELCDPDDVEKADQIICKLTPKAIRLNVELARQLTQRIVNQDHKLRISLMILESTKKIQDLIEIKPYRPSKDTNSINKAIQIAMSLKEHKIAQSFATSLNDSLIKNKNYYKCISLAELHTISQEMDDLALAESFLDSIEEIHLKIDAHRKLLTITKQDIYKTMALSIPSKISQIEHKDQISCWLSFAKLTGDSQHFKLAYDLFDQLPPTTIYFNNDALQTDMSKYSNIYNDVLIAYFDYYKDLDPELNLLQCLFNKVPTQRLGSIIKHTINQLVLQKKQKMLLWYLINFPIS